MRGALLLGCLLLAGCEGAELTAAGVHVRPIGEAPPGCVMIATLRDAEGGGLRTFAFNRTVVEARLRNEAARIGGDSLAVVEEHRGDTDEGALVFANGVSGLTTPSARCTNCVALSVHVFQCGGERPPVAPAAAPLGQGPSARPGSSSPYARPGTSKTTTERDGIAYGPAGGS